MRYLVAFLLCSFMTIMFLEDRALLYPTAVHAQTIGNDTVCFVPGPTDCAMVAVGEIAKAQKTLEIQAYQFTEPHIAQAILAAKSRGVAVRLIVDKTAVNEKNGETQAMASAGIPVWVDYKPHIAHNKVIIIDESVTVGGSLNYSINADLHNAENETVIRDAAWAQAFTANFESRLAASETLADYETTHQN